jgi:integrase
MRAKKPLTVRQIETLKPAPQGKRVLVWDATVPGLAVRVTDKGQRTFVLVARYPGSDNPSPRALGNVGALSLADAREKAQAWHKQIATGADPAVLAEAKAANTFRAIAIDYIAREGRKLRSADWREKVLERLVYPVIGSRPIAEIRRSEIVKLLDKIADERGDTMADRTLALVRKIMNWHATRSDDFRSPIVKGMARTKPKEHARERVLTDDEIRALWRSCGGVFGRFVKFLLLTGARRSEAAQMERSEVDGGDWTLPAARNKTKVDLIRPLSKAAQALVENGEADWVFTTDGVTPISGFSKFKRGLDKVSGVRDYTLHDCRRTARTLMSRAGVNKDHAERCLGHVIGGVRETYDRHEFYREKAQAFEALAALIDRIVKGESAKVIRIK